ncbi:tyrosine-type recombinase/integrase [Leptospira sp. GIMC2001]|uniref:tyrosine-type recombinase/integrase n=1 Tax=Leptospira sp. GIMC2001 TaxID=1513297 RepID=UPI00234A37C1|nr:tyrosine-type recombinase/integrase [Leptospira sp. GIMC2001]WCL50628.1 tyrosine-type recombinase/integrase [Leptospira sp. GIMC2001]
MTKQRKEFITHCKLSGFSDSTIRDYVNGVASLAKRYNKNPAKLTENQIKDFLVELRDQGKSDKRIAGVFYGIRKYFISINQEYKIKSIPTPKRVYHIPTVMSLNEVNIILSVSNGAREKLITGILYASGIRIGELANLRLKDFDIDRKTLFISNPKNGRPRYAILSTKSIDLLNYYKAVYKPKDYLFFRGSNKNDPISIRTLQLIFQNIVKRSKINKKITAHTMRHSFATHLLESGCNILNIQKLLGHANLSTTAIYLHVESSTFLSVNSPYENVDKEASKPEFFMGQPGLNFRYQFS